MREETFFKKAQNECAREQHFTELHPHPTTKKSQDIIYAASLFAGKQNASRS